MSQQTIYITQPDADKLHQLLWDAEATDYHGSSYLKQLRQELERATIVDARQIPPDVITMNATAEMVDVESGEQMRYTLVFPEDADISQGKLSVLAPIGTAMLGYRVGSTFQWDTPDGPLTLRVVNVLFQPEASGNYD